MLCQFLPVFKQLRFIVLSHGLLVIFTRRSLQGLEFVQLPQRTRAQVHIIWRVLLPDTFLLQSLCLLSYRIARYLRMDYSLIGHVQIGNWSYTIDVLQMLQALGRKDTVKIIGDFSVPMMQRIDVPWTGIRNLERDDCTIDDILHFWILTSNSGAEIQQAQ